MKPPTTHRDCTITYTSNDVAPETARAKIELPDGRTYELTERLIRVGASDLADRRRSFVAHIIAKIDHALDSRRRISWPELMIETRHREIPGEVTRECARLRGTR